MASSDAAIMIAAAAVVVGGVTVFKRNKASRLVHAKSEMQGEDGNKENSKPETWRGVRHTRTPMKCEPPAQQSEVPQLLRRLSRGVNFESKEDVVRDGPTVDDYRRIVRRMSDALTPRPGEPSDPLEYWWA